MKTCYFCPSRDTEEIEVRNRFDVSWQAHLKLCHHCRDLLEQVAECTHLETCPTPE